MNITLKNVGLYCLLGTLSVPSIFAGAAKFDPMVDARDQDGNGILDDTELGPIPARVGKRIPSDKFTLRKNDAVLTLGGKSVTEGRFIKNCVMLNKELPDEAGYFKQTLDGKANFAYGEQRYGHKAIELNSVLRFKTYWGKIGESGKTEVNQPFKIDKAPVGVHNHNNSKSIVWIKEAWLQASLNAIVNSKVENIQYLKFGMFPFELGRGIALGSFYGSSKSYLAIYNRSTDYYAPGALLTGTFIKDVLDYDLYYAKLDEKSASFGDTCNSVKEKIVGRRLSPWSGVAQDSDLVAARIKYYPVDSEKCGTLELQPYVLYNEASSQKVDLPQDSKSILGAYGLGVEYVIGNFEIGGEIAANYGHETLYNIDKNKVVMQMIQLQGEPYASLKEAYDLVLFSDKNIANPDNIDKMVPVSQANIQNDIINNTNQEPGGYFTSNDLYRNSGKTGTTEKNRFRKQYQNDYRGWMCVIDAAYLFSKLDLKLAGAYGYASGDNNPHVVEKNKKYKGFVGLQEGYSGKRVRSIIMLDERDVKRPVSLDSGKGNVESESSFSDIQFAGFGFAWSPKGLQKHNFTANTNLLFFWKTSSSPKWDSTTNKVSTTEMAAKFLGTEYNLSAQYDLIKDLTLLGDFAVLFPGGYYKDVKGSPMGDDLFRRLERTDRESLDSAKYRLGDDNAFYFRLALEYKF